MMGWQKKVSLIAQLPNNRVLISRHRSYGNIWSATLEKSIPNIHSFTALDIVNGWLSSMFGIDPTNYCDDYVHIKRESDIEFENMTVLPYTAKFKSNLVLSVPSFYDFSTMDVEEYLEYKNLNNVTYNINHIKQFSMCSVVTLVELKKRNTL